MARRSGGALRALLRAPRRWLERLGLPLRRALRPPDYRRLQERLEAAEANLRNLVWAQNARLALDADQRTLARRSELRVFSQNGEDGILLWLFSRIGVTNGRFVEFGIGDPRGCNSTNLALGFAWSGLLMDCSDASVEAARRFYAEQARKQPVRVSVERCTITRDNIDEALRRNGVEGEIDLLSIDIDGNDYWVWQAIRAVEPRVVMIEYNASLGPDESLVTSYAEDFDRYARHPRGWYHSASLAALARLGRSKGYVLAACDSTGCNAFFVREEVAKGLIEALSPREAYYPQSRRLRVMSEQEQIESLRGLDYVQV